MLKQLVLRKRLEAAKAELEAHRAKKAEFDERKAALEKRSKDAAAALDELTESTDKESREAAEGEAAACDAEEEQIATDLATHDAEDARLDKIVGDLEKEIAELDERTKTPATPPQAPATEERKEGFSHMSNRMKFFKDVTQRDAFFARDDIKGFLNEIRAIKTRDVTNASVGIPVVMLEVLRDNINRYSKLLSYVNVRPVGGETRQNIIGAVPEGVWMEATGALNELDAALNQVSVDGYLVGGYIPVANSYLKDSDISLGTEIMDQLAQAIGKGIDRAILYGTGDKMPIGIVTRLAQTSQPSGWGTYAPTWTDLHTSNVKKLNINGTSGATFYASLIENLAIAKPDYATGPAFWAMNRKTHINIMGKALAFDAAAALLAGVNNQMPIIGGDIIETELVADNEIVGGFGSVYLLAEREGAAVEASEHVKFLQNQTVFKGYARYDGMPVFGEAFVVVSFDNTDAATSATFPTDYANTDIGVLGVTAAAGADVGDTVLTVTGAEASGTTLKYKIGDFGVATGDKPVGYTALTSGTTQITCAAGKTITVVELNGDSRVIKSGKVIAVPKTAG